MQEKFKSLLADDAVFMSALVVLIGVISFGLGRLSVTTEMSESSVQSVTRSPEPFIVYPESAPMVAGVTAEVANAGTLVASRSGTRYHLVSCPGAKQIKEENKIYFASAAAAEAAGYTKAANCPGL